MSESLPPWRPLLRGARQREGRSPQARWLQLATLGRDGAPRVRTLVFRGWGGPAQLDLLTDARSSKSSELQAEPRVELCWLLPKARSQFRLRGQRLAMGPDADLAARQQHWDQLHPGARSLWGWPEPGAPLQAAAAGQFGHDALGIHAASEHVAVVTIRGDHLVARLPIGRGAGRSHEQSFSDGQVQFFFQFATLLLLVALARNKSRYPTVSQQETCREQTDLPAKVMGPVAVQPDLHRRHLHIRRQE